MPSPTADSRSLALFVCDSCKSRKKACDKRLPTCSACSRRNALCVYTPPDEQEHNGAGPPNRRSTGIDAAFFHSLDPTLRSSVLLMDTASDGGFPSSVASFSQLDLNHAVHAQVSRIIKTTGLLIDDIIVRFFTGAGVWMPVISKQRFHDQLLQFGAYPTATFSVLLLSMCLVVYQPAPPGAEKIDQESLYLATKMLFEQTHAIIPTSTNLMQAALLLTGFEYVQRRIYAALMSITTSARMGLAHGYHRYFSCQAGQDADARVKAEERKILWWIVVVFERLIWLELPAKDQPMLSTLPPRDTLLPMEPDWLDELSRTGHTDHKGVPIFPGQNNDVCAFGRAIQGAYVNDSILKALAIRDLDERRNALLSLDRPVQEFLHTVLQQSPCVPIAMAIRGLYEVHLGLIDISEHDRSVMTSSGAALGTATHMLIEIAERYTTKWQDDAVDKKPPTDVYVLSIAIRYIKTGRSGSETPDEDIRRLSAMLDRFDRRWNIVAY